MVDGRSVGSAWQREGAEPDPVTFAIADPADRSRSYLYLLVTYVQGGQVEAHMAIFTRPVSSHGKQVVLDNRMLVGAAVPRHVGQGGLRARRLQLADRWRDAAPALRGRLARRPSGAD